MFIVDTKKSVPLDSSRLDWNPDHMTAEETDFGQILAVPLHDQTIREEVKPFAYDIAARYPWTWPDYDTMTLSLVVDMTRPHPRFSLRVGVQPAQTAESEAPEEWKTFERERLESIQRHRENGGGEVCDTFPVMLTEGEERGVRCSLFDKLGLY